MGWRSASPLWVASLALAAGRAARADLWAAAASSSEPEADETSLALVRGCVGVVESDFGNCIGAACVRSRFRGRGRIARSLRSTGPASLASSQQR